MLSLAALCVSAALVAQIKPVEKSTYEEALAKYVAWIERPTLYKRTIARVGLAETHDLRALDILMKSYKKAEDPKERFGSLIASIAVAGCFNADTLPIYARWRLADRKPTDAWLWYRSLQLNSRAGDLDTVMKAIETSGNVWLKGAAIQALAPASPFDMGKFSPEKQTALYEGHANATNWLADPKLLTLFPSLLPAKSVTGADREVLVRSCAELFLQLKPHRNKPEFDAAAEALIAQLDGDLPEGSKRVVARTLAAAFDKKGTLSLSAADWRRALLMKDWGKKQPKEDPRYAPGGHASFGGLAASGARIVYVVDSSDSMLAKVSNKERLKGSVTGNDEKRDKNEPEIPWDKIETRFDLARELMLASIRKLDEKQRFAVILFGDQTQLLATTQSLIVANKKNYEKVEKELNSIQAGSATNLRPLGTLLGKTNLHGGLDRAFRITSKGLDAKGSSVDGDLVEDGCDLIFVFSDGDPTWDDYFGKDARDPEDQVGDPESRVPLAPTPTLEFPGPFIWRPHLLEDLRRMNLFRGVEIHCIGTGEVTMDLLEGIAAAGLGNAKQIASGG